MLDKGELREYRAMRSKGVSARSAFAYARTVEELDAFPLSDDGTRASFDRDGYNITVRVEADDYYDDWRGSWSSDYSPGAIRNEGGCRDTYEWFHPAITVEEHRQGLQQMGYSKGVAEELARSYVRRDMIDARYTSSWYIVVTAYREGVELGSAAMGGVELGDDVTQARRYVAEIAMDLVPEAIDTAGAILAKLCEQ